MIKAVIFDMDGVIVDSEPLWRRAIVDAVAQFGGSITQQLTYQSTGLRVDEIAEHWIHYCNLDPAVRDRLAHTILELVIEQIRTQAQLLPGVLASLIYLSNNKVKIGLASSSPFRLIEAVLETFDLGQYFSTYMSAEHLTHGKPHPQVYLDTAQKLGVAPYQCLAIEDSVAGLIAAKAARMGAICVPEPSQEHRPEFGIADTKLSSLQELNQCHLIQQLAR